MGSRGLAGLAAIAQVSQQYAKVGLTNRAGRNHNPDDWHEAAIPAAPAVGANAADAPAIDAPAAGAPAAGPGACFIVCPLNDRRIADRSMLPCSYGHQGHSAA